MAAPSIPPSVPRHLAVEKATAVCALPRRVRGGDEPAGYLSLSIDETARSLTKRVPNLEIDLERFVHAAAVDRIVEMLEAFDYRNFAVVLGGETRVRGRKSQREPWRVSLSPLGGASTSTALRNRAFSVSAEEGARTGKGARGPMGPGSPREFSVAVVGEECVDAATKRVALEAMGPKAGFDFAVRHGIAASFFERAPSGGIVSKSTDAFRDLSARALKDAEADAE